MSSGTRHTNGSFSLRRRVSTRRLWPVALAAGALAAALATPSGALAASRHERVTAAVRAWRPAARDTPTEVIDAQTDPQAAGQALDTGCADLSNCSWKADSNITIGYGPPRVLGDALYNCSDEDYAETAVGVSDEREESTSISETLSVEVGLGFLGFEKSTADFEVFSKQSQSFSTTTTSTNAVSVLPRWKGWTETRVLTAFVSGSAYITAGINKLIQVTDIDLSFPGYRDPSDKTDTPIQYIGYRTPMTQYDIASRCGAINGLAGVKPGAPRSVELTLCHPGGGCVTRNVTGTPPPGSGQATVSLARGGRTYATGTDTNGQIQLNGQQPISPGEYTLTIQQNTGTSPAADRKTKSVLTTIVPIAIR
jgi:hypothetical protein